ncbi:ketopantoate reductase family protein [Falsiroseomonas oryzae]|uniref:ketopantoate reductase family protein n=1 Tax=Falsiroseomonas oryzae TaxID=2766473 RepID=UPI0022EA7CBC|nr:2-dehydropantoate 2-reductase N-terminal domain-containing protein [Roseomonas sp. MO-31]
MAKEAEQQAARDAVDRGPILIWGAGAIGGTVGAHLARARHAVVFVDIVADHVAAIRDPARGLAIEGPVASFTATAPAVTPDALQGVFRRVFLCVKTHDTEAACRQLLPHLASDGYVLSLQNGLCERVIAEVCGASRTMGAFVNFGADWLEPGRILYGNRGAVVVGELDGAATPRVTALHALLRDTFEPDAVLTDNIWGYLWGKLAYSSLLYMQGLAEKGIADTLARPELLPLIRALCGEVMAVARAEGVRPLGFNGFDPAAFMPGATENAARASVAALEAFNRPNAKTHSGIWRDLWVRRRATPADAQIGAAIPIGRAHGIACPALARLIAMIHECERGERSMSDDNLTELARSLT